MRNIPPFCLLSCALLLLSRMAMAGDFQIVPGQRIGTVVLGMDRASVRTLLHRPSATRHLKDGMVLDTWLSKAPRPRSDWTSGFKRDYLTVFFRHGRAVQIEVSSTRFHTARGLSTKSAARRWEKAYRPYFSDYDNGDKLPYVFHNPDPDAGSPASKHYVALEDDVRRGVAWKFGAWGNLAPDPDPNDGLEAAIVHLPGQRVRHNPNDGLPYSGTGPATPSGPGE